MEKQFEELYAKMKSAMADRNPDEISALLTPDFTSVDVDNRTSDANTMINSVLARPNDPNKRSETSILSVQIDDSIAHVGQRYHMITDKLGSDGVGHHYELTATSTDDWRHNAGGWLMFRTETKAMDYLVDGQVVAHRIKSD